MISATAIRMAEERFKAWSGSTVETIQGFLDNLATAQAFAPRVVLDKNRMWGKSLDEMIAEAQRLNATDAKRAGVKGLKAKYGKQGAETILQAKTGRKINLR